MGVGTPENILELIDMGADMFDCVMPTRNARNGQLFTNYGTINISNSNLSLIRNLLIKNVLVIPARIIQEHI